MAALFDFSGAFTTPIGLKIGESIKFLNSDTVNIMYFLKPFLKGKISQSGECDSIFWRVRFDFDYHFAFLSDVLKRYNFLLGGIFFSDTAHEKGFKFHAQLQTGAYSCYPGPGKKA